MARDLICPACGKFGFKTTDVFVTGESASLKCVLCGEWSAQPKWKTVAMLIAEVEKLESECKERVSKKMEWLTERNELQSSLTRSKAEGRIEGSRVMRIRAANAMRSYHDGLRGEAPASVIMALPLVTEEA